MRTTLRRAARKILPGTSLSALLVAATSAASSVDTAAIEALAKALSSTETTPCKPEEARAASNERGLPADFDFCQPDRQSHLRKQGMYLSTDGENKALPLKRQSAPAVNSKVVIPTPAREAATLGAHKPFVIELTNSPSNSSNHKIAKETPAHETPTAPHEPTVARSQTLVQRPIKSSPPSTTNLGCPSFQTFAHRGSSDQPENSIPAVLHALKSGHNGVEVDAQQLKDKNWVVHHDLAPGRVSFGSSLPLAIMNSSEWRQVRLLDQHGARTDLPAPFLDDLLVEFKKHASPSQYLNIEIKSGTPYSCTELVKLNRLVLDRLTQSQFMYSSRTMDDLRCLRSTNPNVYLGLVLDPNPASIKIDPSSTTGKMVSLYDRFSKKSASEQIYTENNNRQRYLGRTNFNDIDSLIGPYYGFHIDYRDYWSFASNYTNAKGRLMLYQLNDDRGLAALLKDIHEKQKKLPDAVLTDSNRDFFCSARG